jgi:hypothetical protein
MLWRKKMLLNRYRDFLALLGLCVCNMALARDGQREAVAIVVDGRVIPYQTSAIYLMPGQQFEVQTQGLQSAGEVLWNGHNVDGLTIMSGYRTPFYNRAIGNVPNSRHVFGGAADFYIDDKPQDG